MKKRRLFTFDDDAQVIFTAIFGCIGLIAGSSQFAEGKPIAGMVWLMIPVLIYVFFGFFPARRG